MRIPELGEPALAAALSDFLTTAGADGADPYLAAKRALQTSGIELARAYAKVRAALLPGQCVLDWGCRHAALPWLARAEFGERIELHGCDVCATDDYAAFHTRCGLHYTRLAHPWRLPYPDAQFDTVLAGGTLEHVPNDGESLTELWRVLKPGGALLITHLPNTASWTEFISRLWFPAQAHARRYALNAFRQRLLHHGFDTVAAGHHQLMPSSLPAAWRRPWLSRLVAAVQPLNALENVWPLRRFSATLWLIARRCEGF
ncbi:class I SAM-dependent methyltransferase [Tahibacter sp.]|uniref:class I SAM-dependent methyltransferase n=1 Tax=Tahibacter sp. TaxID=2056211 RepID=UPI0028C43CD2|nr:class I SAM-dependent methyltransferase [Tahibacter sp.]